MRQAPFRPNEISAGGVVVRPSRSGYEVCLVSDGRYWGLPKGVVEAGESPEQAALREIAEETGILQSDLRIRATLSPSEYVYRSRNTGRLVFKQVDRLGNRTLGHAFYRALHTALVVQADEFMPAMERMYAELPEWDFDPDNMPTLSAEEAEALPARTCIHGSPQGPGWKRTLGRGDSFCDPDTVGAAADVAQLG